MIGGFTLKKSGSPAIRQSGNPAIRQSGNPAVWQGVVLDFFCVIITFFIVSMIPSFHTLKAENCQSKCPGDENRCNIETTSTNCTRIGNYYEAVKNAKNARDESATFCVQPDSVFKAQCVQNLQQEYTQADRDLRNLIDRIHQEQKQDTEKCDQAKRELRRVNLPPECKGRRSTCQTDAEKCRGLLGQLGSGQGFGGSSDGPIAITSLFQNKLASQCPQAASAKFDDDEDRLRELVDDHSEAQDEVYELQDELQDGIVELQEDRSDLDAEIQETTKAIKDAPATFEGATAQIQEELSGEVTKLRREVLGMNRAIRAKIRELESIQNNDNNKADQALVRYRGKVAQIFTRCDGEAKDRMAALRGQLNNQVRSGTVQRVADATKENRLENLRQTAIRAYARCRHSQTTQNQVKAALEQYELEQRAISRREQGLIDEIESLRENIEEMHAASEAINESGQRAYKDAQQQYVSALEDLTNQLQMKNLEKQRLDANFAAQHQQLQSRLFNERVRATQLNGEMTALEQVVKASRPTSIFGNLDYGEYDSLNEYDREYDNAYDVCCRRNSTDDSICDSTSAGSYRARSSRGRGRSKAR